MSPYSLGLFFCEVSGVSTPSSRTRSVEPSVIASGGLSHPVVDESFDRDIIEAMESDDRKYLLSYHEGYYQSGSSEIKSWIAMNGALRDSYLKCHLADYQPLYRTPAGTGSSAAFMYWKM